MKNKFTVKQLFIFCLTITCFTNCTTSHIKVAWKIAEQSSLKFSKISPSFVHKNLLLLRNMAQLIAYDKHSGKRYWSYPKNSDIGSEPVHHHYLQQVNIHDDFIYLFQYHSTRQQTGILEKRMIVKLDIHTGKPLWTRVLKKKEKLIIISQKLILVKYKKKWSCIDAENGQIKWANNQDNRFYHSFYLKDGIIYTTSNKNGNSYLSAIHYKTGKIKWTKLLKYAQTNIIQVKGEKLLAYSEKEHLLTTYDFQGNLLWETKQKINTLNLIPNLITPSVLYLPSYKNERLKALNIANGDTLWSSSENLPGNRQPVRYKTYLAINKAANSIVLLNPKNGQLVKEILLPGNGIATNLVGTSKHLFYADYDNKVYAISIR